GWVVPGAGLWATTTQSFLMGPPLAGVTWPTVNPSATIWSLAFVSVMHRYSPTLRGAGVGATVGVGVGVGAGVGVGLGLGWGPFETTYDTGVPFAAWIPPAGFVLTMAPAGTVGSNASDRPP